MIEITIAGHVMTEDDLMALADRVEKNAQNKREKNLARALRRTIRSLNSKEDKARSLVIEDMMLRVACL